MGKFNIKNILGEGTPYMLPLLTIILGTSVSGLILAKGACNSNELSEDDRGMSIAVITFWLLTLGMAMTYGDKVSSTYVILTGLNLAVSSLVIHRYDDGQLLVDENLNNLAVVAVSLNTVALFLSLYDISKLQQFKNLLKKVTNKIA